MRVLFTCVPQTGHIFPLLPLAEAFVARGDDVLFAAGSDAAAPVTERGFAFQTAGPSFGEWYGRLVARTRGMPGDGLPPERVERYFLPRLFGEVGTAALLDDLLDAGRAFRPDLLVFEPMTYAGPLAAAVLEVPAVLHTIGPSTAPENVELVADAISPIWREFGKDVPADAGLYAGRVVTICPPSLDPAGAQLANATPLRPTALPRVGEPPSDLPKWLWERPVVYATLGTFSNTNSAVFQLFFDVLADLEVNAVVTTGRDNDPAALGNRPSNVHVTQFIPQADLLPHCTAALHHAGAGTTFGIVAHGLPSVAVPQSADNFTIAARLSAAGAARTLMPHEVTKTSLGAALREVLEQSEIRAAAHQVADEIAGMQGPAQVADTLAQPATD